VNRHLKNLGLDMFGSVGQQPGQSRPDRICKVLLCWYWSVWQL